MPDEAKEDGAEETRAAIDGGMSEATSGFLEQATSSNIWVSMSRESAGFCFSKLSKASFSCAIAFCTCDTNSSRRGGQRVTCVHACTKDMNMHAPACLDARQASARALGRPPEERTTQVQRLRLKGDSILSRLAIVLCATTQRSGATGANRGR